MLRMSFFVFDITLNIWKKVQTNVPKDLTEFQPRRGLYGDMPKSGIIFNYRFTKNGAGVTVKTSTACDFFYFILFYFSTI
jgi:hypothetical protein